MANLPTTAQLKMLCERVDMLILVSESLQQLRQQRPQALDRECEKTGRVGANPTLEAVRTAFLPEEMFPITDFLVLSTRERTFAALYHRIGIMITRTEVLRRFYDRPTQTFNRRACQQNHPQLIAQFTDFEDLLAQTNYYISVCNNLRQIIHAN